MRENSDRDFLMRFMANNARGEELAGASPIAGELNACLLALEAGKGTATLSVVFGETHLNGAGVITGGILATAMDFAMALALLARLGEAGTIASIHLDAQFYQPARPGKYLVEARMDSMSKRVAFMRATLEDGEGTEVAAATSIMSLRLA